MIIQIKDTAYWGLISWQNKAQINEDNIRKNSK